MCHVLEFWERSLRDDGNHTSKRWTVKLPEADGFKAIGEPIYLSDDSDLCETYFISPSAFEEWPWGAHEDKGIEADKNNQWHAALDAQVSLLGHWTGVNGCSPAAHKITVRYTKEHQQNM